MTTGKYLFISVGWSGGGAALANKSAAQYTWRVIHARQQPNYSNTVPGKYKRLDAYVRKPAINYLNGELEL